MGIFWWLQNLLLLSRIPVISTPMSASQLLPMFLPHLLLPTQLLAVLYLPIFSLITCPLLRPLLSAPAHVPSSTPSIDPSLSLPAACIFPHLLPNPASMLPLLLNTLCSCPILFYPRSSSSTLLWALAPTYILVWISPAFCILVKLLLFSMLPDCQQGARRPQKKWSPFFCILCPVLQPPQVASISIFRSSHAQYLHCCSCFHQKHQNF